LDKEIALARNNGARTNAIARDNADQFKMKSPVTLVFLKTLLKNDLLRRPLLF
jgi:hypothetical protein